MRQNSVLLRKIGNRFNTKSFVNAHDHIKHNNPWLTDFLASQGQIRRLDYPRRFDIPGRLKQKWVGLARDLKVTLQNTNFGDLIDRIIEIDRDDSLYASYLQEPWYPNNTPPSMQEIIARWHQIFDTAASRNRLLSE